jgi:hypothetical protein
LHITNRTYKSKKRVTRGKKEKNCGALVNPKLGAKTKEVIKPAPRYTTRSDVIYFKNINAINGFIKIPLWEISARSHPYTDMNEIYNNAPIKEMNEMTVFFFCPDNRIISRMKKNMVRKENDSFIPWLMEMTVVGDHNIRNNFNSKRWGMK